MQAVVIGAGIGGLAVSCLLAKKGYSVTVIERTERVGGKLSEFTEGGFRFDTGPSLLTMPFVLEKLYADCGAKMSDHLELVPLHPICRYVYPDGTVFDCSHDVKQTVASIRTFAGADADAYEGFLRYSENLYKRTANAFLFNKLSKWADLKNVNFFDLLRIDAFTTVSDRVDATFKTPYLRQFFKRFTTYNGSSPYLAPATLNVIPYVELVQGGYYVKGGLYSIATSLHKLAESLGVRFEFNQTIQQIDVEEGVAMGVDGRRFDIVVSNSDSTDTYTRLLPDSVVSKPRKASFSAIEPSCSGFVLMLGLDTTYPQLAHHNIFFSENYEKEFQEIFKRKRLPEDPTIYIANTSYSDPDHAPEGGSNLYILVNAPYTAPGQDWESLKETYADHIIRILRLKLDGGIQSHIKVKHVITPADFEQRYRSNKGSIYGTSSNSRYAAFLRPRNASPLVKGLYLVGGSTHPGGGIPLCILSANHVISSL